MFKIYVLNKNFIVDSITIAIAFQGASHKVLMKAFV